jgi:MASE1
MWGSAYDFLSPRPSVGQVAALWVPNAVLMVAVLRNLKRPLFVSVAVALFYLVGLFRTLQNGDFLATFVLLSFDVVEVFLLVWLLHSWGGQLFQIDGALSVAIFTGAVLLVCGLVGIGVGFASTMSLGNSPIATEAPFSVGLGWLLGDSATHMLIGAPLLALSGRGGAEFVERTRGEALNAVMVVGLTLIVVGISLWLPVSLKALSGVDLGNGGLSLMTAPLAIFVAFQRGPIAGALIGAVIGVPAVYATMAGLGPFREGHVSFGVFELQTTLILSMATILLVGAMSQELRARSEALERTLEEAMRAKR